NRATHLCADERGPCPRAGEDCTQQRQRIEVAFAFDYQPITQGDPVADAPGDRSPAEGAAQGQLDVGAVSPDRGAFHLPMEVRDEREQRPGEAFPERSLAHQRRKLRLDESYVRVEPRSEMIGEASALAGARQPSAKAKTQAFAASISGLSGVTEL